MAVDLVYETHSLTEDNENGIASGWLPGRLSARGRRLAAELGARRRDTGLAAVYVSDLHRAVETADIAFAGTTVPVHRDPRLRECDYGELNGGPVSVVAAERARRIDTPYPGGQSYRQVIRATNDFLHDLAGVQDGRRVLLIAHSANKWALDCLLTGAVIEELVDAPFNWQEGWHYTLPAGWPGTATDIDTGTGTSTSTGTSTGTGTGTDTGAGANPGHHRPGLPPRPRPEQ